MFIRKKIYLYVEQAGILTYDYGYEIMKNIYQCISVENKDMEVFLHNQGYSLPNGQRYKLFNHTLQFMQADFQKQGILLKDESKIILTLSGKEKLIRMIINGLFKKKSLHIGQIVLKLRNISNDVPIQFERIMKYKTISPIVTSVRENNRVQYIPPYDVDIYFKNLAFNAMRKYEVFFGKPYQGEIAFDIEDAFSIKEKLFGVKEGKVKGYMYDFWVEADEDMQKVLYYLGVGEKNSIGFGTVDWYPERG